MNSPYIKIPMVHPNNIEGDTTVHLRTEFIAEVRVATIMDRRQRDEIRCLVFNNAGAGVATTLDAARVMDLIREAQQEFPTLGD